jgi:hypothetical protein
VLSCGSESMHVVMEQEKGNIRLTWYNHKGVIRKFLKGNTSASINPDAESMIVAWMKRIVNELLDGIDNDPIVSDFALRNVRRNF